MGMVLEVVIVTSLGGEVHEVPLPEVELLEGWVPLEGVAQVVTSYFRFIWPGTLL